VSRAALLPLQAVPDNPNRRKSKINSRRRRRNDYPCLARNNLTRKAKSLYPGE
jgi:hypothetical protein